jgi:hypothetical protein
MEMGERNELKVFEATQAVAKAKGANYTVMSPLTGAEVKLVRDVDFGVVPKTKSPSLYKAGAEKVCMAYGLMQRYSIESKIEQANGDDALFFYTVKCELVKIATNGQEYVFSSAYGSANTREKRNGFNGAFDAANSTLKMAQKRALVAAALSVSGLSSMFTQDMEDEKFMSGYTEIQETLDENAPITAKQVKRIFAIANEAGISANKAKNMILAKYGISSTKEITQKQYDEVCSMFEQENS